MSLFPQQDKHENIWGTMLRDFFYPYFDLDTGAVKIDSFFEDNTINGSKLIDTTVDGSKLKELTVSTAKIANSSITVDKLASNSVTLVKISSDVQGGAAGNYALRQLGTTAETACAGNDPRLTGGGAISSLPTVDFTCVGPYTSIFTAYGTVTQGTCVVLVSGGGFETTDANFESMSSGMLAVALETKTNGNNVLVALPNSYIKNSAWSFAIGANLFLSETPGVITSTPPDTVDVIVRKVGYAVTSNVIYFNPSPDWLTHV